MGMKALFWVSIALVVYVYVGYPLLLAAWVRIRSRSVRRAPDYPAVSVIVAARNEAHRIAARVSNLLEQDYPGALQIIVVSDGSTDGTRDALARFDERVDLVELQPSGKPAALNAGVARARDEVLVFADARQRFAPDAIRRLVENFADPSVGAATGELLLDCEDRQEPDGSSSVAESVAAYWQYEKWLRRKESAVWSTLGATGAIYAMRRSLWRPLPVATLLDDVLAPMRVVLAGYRVVFDDRAKAFDWVEPDTAGERRRKVRTLAGNFQIVGLEPAILNPLRNPVWFQYFSHKLGRLLVPYAMAAAFVANAALATAGVLYSAGLAAQIGFYALAAYGAWLERERVDDVDRPRGTDRVRLRGDEWRSGDLPGGDAAAPARVAVRR
jgi:cellulose synthase/poly-beta-1,6-N-acetylglucosamine synthase-like glycosyltransferase